MGNNARPDILYAGDGNEMKVYLRKGGISYVLMKVEKTGDVEKELEVNNRFYNERWQLIGSHDNRERFYFWDKIREKVEYKIENMPCFQGFLDSYHHNTPWNVTNAKARKPKKVLNFKIF